MNTFLENLNSGFEHTTASINKFYEASLHQYELDQSNIETLIIANECTADEASYLYEEARTILNSKKDKFFKLMTEAVNSYIDSYSDRINKLKSEYDLSEYEKQIKSNPFMRKGEIKVINTDSYCDSIERVLNKIESVSVKVKSGVFGKEEINSLRKEYIDAKSKYSEKEELLSIPKSFTFAKGLIDRYFNERNLAEANRSLNKIENAELLSLAKDMVSTVLSARLKMLESILKNLKTFSKSIGGKEKMNETEVKESVLSDLSDIDTGFNEILTELLESVAETNDDYELFSESARFTILPRFKSLKAKYPELKEAESLVELIDAELSREGYEPTVHDTDKLGKLINSILNFLANLNSALSVPFLIFIVPIFPYLLNRYTIYVGEKKRLRSAEQELREVRAKLNKLKNNAEDPKARKKYENLINQVDDTMDNLLAGQKTKAVKESTVFDTEEETVESVMESVMALSNEEKLEFVREYLEDAQNTKTLQACNEINQFLESARNEAIRGITKDVSDDFITNSLDVEIY